MNYKYLIISAFLLLELWAFPFAFIFAGAANGVDLVAHPMGYNGTGGIVTVTVGIHPNSPNALDMVIPTQNVVAIFNGLNATTGNLKSGNLSNSDLDFESVLLHEMGHSLGLAHCNLGSQAGVTGTNTDFTNSTPGADLAWDFNTGSDAIVGSVDDDRDDDVNLFWFNKNSNDPFAIAGTVDSSAYSRDVSDLPSGDIYAANPSRDVAATNSLSNTEAVMNQGTFLGEDQRTLGHDDIAGLRFAMAGIDRTAGTSDDYTLELNYIGLDSTANIVIAFDDTKTGMAVSNSGGSFISANDIAITSNNIYFHSSPSGFGWHFNSAVLALNITDVIAQHENGVATINWFTLDESNLDVFQVERSFNAIDWEMTDEQWAQGNSYGEIAYESVDANIPSYASVVYYRIKQISLEGIVDISKVVSVRPKLVSPISFKLYPNPVNANSRLLIPQDLIGKSYQLSILNQIGQVVAQEEVNFSSSNSNNIRSLEKLAKGNYYLKISDGSTLCRP